jgi:recombinational DNA repair ATPase RecF
VKVRKIHSRNFQVGGGSVDLEFPDRGLVLVTGPNGHGKSSLIESVAFGCWGETLRGRSPWVDGLAGELTVETDLSSVERSATKAGCVRSRRMGVTETLCSRKAVTSVSGSEGCVERSPVHQK